MATTITNARTMSTIMQTVGKGAQSVGALFDSATNTVGMLDSLVSKASQDQKDRYKIERKVYRERLIREATQEQAETDIKTEEFRKQSPDHAKFYDTAYAEFSAIFDD